MKCDKCKQDFQEKEIESSHDFPQYLGGTDLDGRHWLCKNCHDKYERMILSRIYCFVYKQLIPFPKSRKDLIPYMTLIKKEKDAFKKAKIWHIVDEAKEEFYGVSIS